MTRELTAATEHAGVRLDAFLSADGALTRSQAARLIADICSINKKLHNKILLV